MFGIHKLFIGLCAASMLSSACTPRKATRRESEGNLTMFVGTYTSGSSKGIYTFRFNENTGEGTPLSETVLPNPSYITLSADNRFVYAVSEQDDKSASVNAFALDREKGTLTPLNTQPTIGEAPCYVSTDGQRVITANYSGGNMSVFPLRYDGSLEPVDTLYYGEATGADKERQALSHVHCSVFTPDGNYVFATDFSADRVLRYAVHPKAARLRPLTETVEIEPSSGPRHLTFSPNGRFAYLISELSGKVTAFSYADGRLKPIQTITADTLQARGSADIHLSPDGNYLYASNRLEGDGIAIFQVTPETGILAKVGYQNTGVHPRSFNITPNGKYLLVACRDSNVIQVFERDVRTGLLINTGKDIKLDKPVCIVFAAE